MVDVIHLEHNRSCVKLNKKFPKYYTIDSKPKTVNTIGKLRTRVLYSKAYKESK